MEKEDAAARSRANVDEDEYDDDAPRGGMWRAAPPPPPPPPTTTTTTNDAGTTIDRRRRRWREAVVGKVTAEATLRRPTPQHDPIIIFAARRSRKMMMSLGINGPSCRRHRRREEVSP